MNVVALGRVTLIPLLMVIAAAIPLGRAGFAQFARRAAENRATSNTRFAVRAASRASVGGYRRRWLGACGGIQHRPGG
jgi:hypothetical protein